MPHFAFWAARAPSTGGEIMGAVVRAMETDAESGIKGHPLQGCHRFIVAVAAAASCRGWVQGIDCHGP